MDPTSEPSVEGAAQARDAKTAMLEIAEQLISERGLDRVSMRDVATAAGQRNNSAVQYHFGSRDGLILQVLRRRLTALDVDRRQRLAEIDEQGLGTDLAALVRVLFEPIVELLRSQPESTYYARFLQRVGPVMAPGIPEAQLRTATDDVVVRLIDVLSHLPRRVAFERIDLATQMFTGTLAVYEDRRDARNTVVNADFDKVVAHLYDMVEAALRAGVGPGESHVADAPEAEVGSS
ncbi:TetR family transcriptional regulator [Dietzia kunjamensis]|uniref:TetR/AcrR family transcriptional regulator n=1 Tax=Dietzia kunjamensis TaxID=322509 RepID=UPI000E72EE5D|nr:TetR/AcrR family transcriptional regulator [Dietzia kunjamensis]MBB1011213.1 TetR/AcrR family transcriptional regulator [Dietzia kunjamensis]RKE68927.1 TetR family transcriptional regulator [Dietzia kunjamensis]